jgi:hypothetical protein
MNSTTKIRIVLASVAVLFLILIGYLIYLNYLDYEWTVQALIFGSFGFFGTFTISSYSALFTTLLLFGIFILPFVINELGILDNHPDEPPDDFIETGQSVEEAEEQVDRLFGFLKGHFGSVKKIGNLLLPIGITSAILGGFLITLPSIFLIDSELIFIPEAEEWFVREYYGFIRGQLLLIGILLLIIALIVIGLYIHRRPFSWYRKIV